MAEPSQIRSIGRSTHTRLLVIGEPGSGKTKLAGTSPKGLILRPPTDHTDSIPSSTTCKEWVMHDWSEADEVLEYLRHEGQKVWKWVWVDSISLWQDTGLDDIWDVTVARKPSRGEYGPDKGEYGINMHRLGVWIRNLCELNMNIGITAHPFRYQDSDGETTYMPWIQGKNMPDKICGYMNIVGYLMVRERKEEGGSYRLMLTNRRGKWYAKDQFDAFGGKIIEPTIPKMMKLIEESRMTERSNQPARKKKRSKKNG